MEIKPDRILRLVEEAFDAVVKDMVDKYFSNCVINRMPCGDQFPAMGIPTVENPLLTFMGGMKDLEDDRQAIIDMIQKIAGVIHG
jgi:hypothetical protein